MQTAESPNCRNASPLIGAKVLVPATVALLSVYTVSVQIQLMGLEWYESVQWGRTLDVLEGRSGTPWQYRLFTESIVYATVKMFESLGIPRPVGAAFVAIRLLQNALAFWLAYLLYRRFGLDRVQSLFGVSFLAWGMCHALYDSDFAFNTYTDLSLFSAAGLLILHGREVWLIPLMVAAAFNRETSGCIPFMLLFAHLQLRPKLAVPRRILIIFIACLAVYIGVVGGLRLVYGLRPYIVPTAGVEPILPLLTYNLTWWRTWVFLFATLGLLPLMALASWRAWPRALHAFFWAVVPVWFPIHFSLAHAPETRLFLVPSALIFIPGALLGIRLWGGAVNAQPHPRSE